jgi:hypothetical protein
MAPRHGKDSAESRRHGTNHYWILAGTVSLLLTVQLSCNARDQGRSTALRDQDHTIDTALSTMTVSGLIDSLMRVEGTFNLRPDQTWTFTGNRDVTMALIKREDSAIPSLVECLSRFDSAAARVNSRHVLAGALCGEVLMRAAIVLEHEDGSGDWEGVVEPDAQPSDLRAAARAWRDVLARRAYRIP